MHAVSAVSAVRWSTCLLLRSASLHLRRVAARISTQMTDCFFAFLLPLSPFLFLPFALCSVTCLASTVDIAPCPHFLLSSLLSNQHVRITDEAMITCGIFTKLFSRNLTAQYSCSRPSYVVRVMVLSCHLLNRPGQDEFRSTST